MEKPFDWELALYLGAQLWYKEVDEDQNEIGAKGISFISKAGWKKVNKIYFGTHEGTQDSWGLVIWAVLS